MDNNTDDPKPVPQPRRLVTLQTNNNSTAYENVSIDLINKNIQINDDNLHCNERAKIQNNKTFLLPSPNNGNNDSYKNVITEVNNLNIGKNKNIEEKNILQTHDSTPVPAPRKTTTKTPSFQENSQRHCTKDDINIPQKPFNNAPASGAIKKTQNTPPRKAPEIPIPTASPKFAERNYKLRQSSETSTEEVLKSLNVSHSKSNTSLNSSQSGISASGSEGQTPTNTKYVTSSPGALLKSLGATSKLLTESLTERLTVHTKDAKHKIEKIHKTSVDKISETKNTATTHLKNVRKTITNIGDNLSLGRPKERNKATGSFDLERPQTVPADDEVFQSISFNSPLNSKTSNCYNLAEAEESYQVPRNSIPVPYDSIYPSYKLRDIEANSDTSSIDKDWNTSFERNSNLTQSMFSSLGKLDAPLPATRKINNRSASDLKNIEHKKLENEDSSSSVSSTAPDLPCPNYPAPINNESVYGKLLKSLETSSTDSSRDASPIKAPMRIKRRKDTSERNNTHHRTEGDSNRITADSNRATVDSNEYIVVSSEEAISSKYRGSDQITTTLRSDSWDYREANDDRDDTSSPEPIYVNDCTDNIVTEPVYGLLYNPELIEENLLTPQRQAATRKLKCHSEPNTSSHFDILKEFDPLVSTTVDKILLSKSNELILLEGLLGQETYGCTSNHQSETPVLSDEENSNDMATIIPETPPTKPRRKITQNSTEKTQSVIIHQNPHLRSDSMENIVDEATITPYLAQCVENNDINNLPVDLSHPSASRSNWFVEVNEQTSEKQLNNKTNNIVAQKGNLPHPSYAPPSYSEAIGETNIVTTAAEDSKQNPADDSKQNPADDSKQTPPKSAMKSMFSNVLTKMEGMNLSLRRKPSLKSNTSIHISEVKTILEMISRPPLAQRLILHDGNIMRLPSGKTDDILKEHQSRKAFIREKMFQAYFDKELKTPKECFSLEHITSIQCVSNQKFTNNSIELHCFEITTSIPKQSSSSNNLSNPNMIMTSTNSGNTKIQRICHLYGVAKESDRFLWMQKLLESITDVFPSSYTCKYYRAGWCYLKHSITSEWSSAWILLQKEKKRLLCYSYSNMNLECLDLRKARCLVLKDHDESINNLHVEEGPILMVDCPPFSTYMIMNSPRETKVWRHLIKVVAHNNGPALKEQQLTKDDVSVLVDKCINFVYAHGSMSEGIYRKSGSENSIQKLLNLFRTDAFSVQIIRSDYNEHDIANVLKRFMRDLPDRLLGKYAVSFISVSEMKSKKEKILAYKDLLNRLPTIEYQTLKKLIGHLNFIQSQKQRNKMGVDNLSIIWGPTLLATRHSEMQYSQNEADVVADLIMLYKKLYLLTEEDLTKEQIMLTVLQRYHAAAENLSDSVKKSGDLRVWITIDSNPENVKEEKNQINVTLTPTKTVYDVCKELAPKMNKEPFAVTLSEIILNGDLSRPLHHSDKVFDVVLQWSYWSEEDRKDNFLRLQPMKFLKDVERALKNLPTVSPNKELKFADFKTKAFKAYTLELTNDHIVVMKKEKSVIVPVKDIDLKKSTAYIGCERKRSFQLRWAITLIDKDEGRHILRTRESPYFGHVIAGTNSNDLLVWYSSILHSLHGDDLMPNPEIIIP